MVDIDHTNEPPIEKNNARPYEICVTSDCQASITIDESKVYSSLKVSVSYQLDTENAASVLSDEYTSEIKSFQLGTLSSNIEYAFTFDFLHENSHDTYSGKFLIKALENEVGYYIEQYDCTHQAFENPSTIPQQITLTPEEKAAQVETMAAGDKWEQEPNNAYNVADQVYDGYNAYGYMTYAGDIDYFKIKFSVAGTATITLQGIPAACNYNLELRNSSDTFMYGSYKGRGLSEIIDSVNVDPNVWYYIRVNSAESTYNTSAFYTLSVKNYPKKDDYEYNNNTADAKLISDGSEIEANIHNQDDKDYFKFEITGAAKVAKITLNIPSGHDYDLYLLNSAGTTIASSTDTIKLTEEIIKDLSAGIYYIIIISADGSYSGDKYTLSLQTSAVGSMNLGTSAPYSISTNNRRYHMFSISAKTGVQISVSTTDSTDYDIYLYQLYTNKYGIVDKACTGQNPEVLSKSLISGTYLIEIVRYSGTGSSYTLSTNCSTTSDGCALVASNYPTTMISKTQSSVTIKATNIGANAWTLANQYQLVRINNSSSFISTDLTFTSTDVIEYGQSKEFTFNITAPDVTTSTTYVLGWQLKKGTSDYYQSISMSITVLPVETISTNDSKTISGKTEQYYKITIMDSGYYAFRTVKTSTKCDTLLNLLNSNMSSNADSDDYGDSVYSLIEKYMSAGTYYIKVSAYEDAVVYCKLIVEPYSYKSITVGGTANISNTYEAYYTFTVSDERTYAIYTKKYNTNCNTYLQLFRASGGRVTKNNDNIDEYSRIEYELTAGSYYVKVSNYLNWSVGEDSKTNCTLTVVPIGSVITPPQQDTASISITDPSVTTLRTYNGGSVKVSGKAYNVSGVSMKVNGASVSNIKKTGSSYEGYFIPQTSGIYTILISGTAAYGGNDPSSQITVTILVNDDGDDFMSASAIQEGTERIAAIDIAGDADFFSFIPNKTGVYFAKTLGSTDTVMEMYDSLYHILGFCDDYEYAEPNDYNASLSYEMEAGKTYYIKVYHNNAQSLGQYKILIENIAGKNDAPTELYVNQKKANRFGYEGQTHIYVFHPTVSKTYTIQTFGTTNTVATVCDSDITLASDNNSGVDNNFLISVDLTSGQTYYIYVKDMVINAFGNKYDIVIN